MDEGCGRECEHKGWQILEGKIVEDQEPPQQIAPYSNGRFSVSGREGTTTTDMGNPIRTLTPDWGSHVCTFILF